MIYKIHRSFSSAHFYHQPQWDETRNRQEFGLCYTKHGHGHDYRLEIELETENLNKVTSLIDAIVQRLDHQHLNFEIPEFKTKIPTTENLALYLQKELKESLSAQDFTFIKLKLLETPEIWVELC